MHPSAAVLYINFQYEIKKHVYGASVLHILSRSTEMGYAGVVTHTRQRGLDSKLKGTGPLKDLNMGHTSSKMGPQTVQWRRQKNMPQSKQ